MQEGDGWVRLISKDGLLCGDLGRGVGRSGDFGGGEGRGIGRDRYGGPLPGCSVDARVSL